MQRTTVFVIASCLAAGCAAERPAETQTAPARESAGDGTPQGMVAFFLDGACPAGWSSADLARGRMIVGVTNPASVRKTVGVALTDKQVPVHQAKYSGAVTVGTQDLKADGGPNHDGTSPEAYALSGDTKANDTKLPFIQLVVCEKQ